MLSDMDGPSSHNEARETKKVRASESIFMTDDSFWLVKGALLCSATCVAPYLGRSS